MFKRSLLVLFICLSAGLNTRAQNAARIYVEPDGWGIGTTFGMTDLWGDIGTKSLITHYTNGHYFDKIAFMGGLFARYSVHPCFGIRMQAAFGSLYASDGWNSQAAGSSVLQGDDAYQRFARSQTAKDNIFELQVLMEWLPFRSNPETRRAAKRGQPFIALGLAGLHFTQMSQAGSDGPWVNTYNLHLEGQGWGGSYPKQYNQWQAVIPFGIGYRWDIGQHLNLGIEYIYRYTFTDYLDGVSGKYVGYEAFKAHLTAHDAALAQSVADKEASSGLGPTNPAGNMRGNPATKDAYSSLNITFYYKIETRTRTWFRH